MAEPLDALVRRSSPAAAAALKHRALPDAAASAKR
jgi:hypothetical protein